MSRSGKGWRVEPTTPSAFSVQPFRCYFSRYQDCSCHALRFEGQLSGSGSNFSWGRHITAWYALRSIAFHATGVGHIAFGGPGAVV